MHLSVSVFLEETPGSVRDPKGMFHAKNGYSRSIQPELTDNLIPDGFLGVGTDNPVDQLAMGEEHDGRNRRYIELQGYTPVIVGVTLAKRDFTGKFLREFVHDRSDTPAGPAPFCPEIYHRKRMGAYKFLKMHLINVRYIPGFLGVLHLFRQLLYTLLPYPGQLIIHADVYSDRSHLIVTDGEGCPGEREVSKVYQRPLTILYP